MSTVEMMTKYIQNTKMGNPIRYEIYMGEIMEMCNVVNRDQMIRMICLAFCYGRAKGYRMAKKEAARG